MNNNRPNTARILVHSEGLGTPHMELLRQRAQELATINGRSAFSEEDWRQAKIELHGGHNHELTGSDEMGMSALVSEADMVATDMGHHTENVHPEGDGNLGEELVAEGMEEAEHERMLAAREEFHELDEDDAEEKKDEAAE